MVKRFEETVNIGPAQTVAVRTGGAQAALSLADKLEGFKQQAFRVAREEAAQRGIESGQQVELTEEGGVTQAPEMKEEGIFGFIGSIEREAHNKTLQAAYLSSLNNDNRENISRIAAENPDNLISFNEQVESYRKGVLDSVEMSVRPAVAEDLDNKITSARIQVQGNTIKRQDAENTAILNDGVEQASNGAFRATRNGDFVLAGEERVAAFQNIDALVESGKLSLDRANARKREIDREIAEQGIRRGVDELPPEEAYAAIDEISQKIPEGWTPDEWDRFMGEMTSDVTTQLNARNTTNAVALQDFEVQRRLDGDDTQVLDKKAVDRVYDEEFANLDNGQKAFFVDRTKMVPTDLKKQINSDLLTGNPEVMISSLDMINRIDNIPGIADPFTAENRAFAEIATDLSKNLAPREAIKIAKEQTDPRNTKRVEAAQSQLDTLVKDGDLDYDSDVESVIETGFFRTNVKPSPINQANMTAEYKTLVDAHFKAGMPLDSAKDKAEQLMQRNWREEDFLGRKEARKYPLQDYYAVDGSIEYLEKQIIQQANDPFFTARDYTKDEIFLLSDDRTAKEATLGKPTYLIYFIKDGLIESSGIRFVPNIQTGIDQRDESLKAARREALQEQELIKQNAEITMTKGLMTMDMFEDQ